MLLKRYWHIEESDIIDILHIKYNYSYEQAQYELQATLSKVYFNDPYNCKGIYLLKNPNNKDTEFSSILTEIFRIYFTNDPQVYVECI